MISDSAAAQLGLLVQYATDMCAGPQGLTTLEPRPDHRLAPDWTIRGYICGADASLKPGSFMEPGERDVCYGFLAESTHESGAFVAVIRDVEGIVEWIDGAEFATVPCPGGGSVERGFWAVYKTLELRINGDQQDIVSGIVSSVGSGALMVVGHGLGGALATYLTLDLADPTRLGKRASTCLFASPQTGDSEFVWKFDRTVESYNAYNYDMDIVPRAPIGIAFATLPRTRWISPSEARARIRFDFHCHHHLLCYCAMLDFSSLEWSGIRLQDEGCEGCILSRAGDSDSATSHEDAAITRLRNLQYAATQWEQRTSGFWRGVRRTFWMIIRGRRAIWRPDILDEVSELTKVLRDLLVLGYASIGPNAADARSGDGYHASSDFKAHWEAGVTRATDKWLDYARVFIEPAIAYIRHQSESLAQGFSTPPVGSRKVREAFARLGKYTSVIHVARSAGTKEDIQATVEFDTYCAKVQKFIKSKTERMSPLSLKKQKLRDLLKPIDEAMAAWRTMSSEATRPTSGDTALNRIDGLGSTLKKLGQDIDTSTARVREQCDAWLKSDTVKRVRNGMADEPELKEDSDAIEELEHATAKVLETRRALRSAADDEVSTWTDDSLVFFRENAKSLLGIASAVLLVFGALDVWIQSRILGINLLEFSDVNDLIKSGALMVPWMAVAGAASLMAYVAGKWWAKNTRRGGAGAASLSRLSRYFVRIILRFSPLALLSISVATLMGLTLLVPALWTLWTLWQHDHMRGNTAYTRIYLSNATQPLRSSGIVDATSNYVLVYGTGVKPPIWIVPRRHIRCIEDGKERDRKIGAACNGQEERIPVVMYWSPDGAPVQHERFGFESPPPVTSVRKYVQEVEDCKVPKYMPLLSIGFAFDRSERSEIRSWFYDPADNWGFRLLPRDPPKFNRIAFVQSPKEANSDGSQENVENGDLIKQIKLQLVELDRLVVNTSAHISSLWLVGLSSQRGEPTDNQVLANDRIRTVVGLLKEMHFKNLPTIRRRALGVNVLTGRRLPKRKWLDQRVVIVPCQQSVYR